MPYGKEDRMSYSATPNTVSALLGGKKVVKHNLSTPLDFIQTVENGLPSSSLKVIQKSLDLSIPQLGHLLGLSPRTIARLLKSDIKLSPAITESVLQIAEVYSKGIDLFESPKKLQEWLRTPNSAMDGVKPIDLMMYSYGIDLVKTVLGRIEWGVHS
jgi:putative toxin-antitoxin system antitoxin component (TIGR02293 family)